MILAPNETLEEVNEHIRLIRRNEGLTFGTDAYLLAAYVRAKKSARAVDLGSGTGIIPLLCLAREKAAHFCAVELHPAFAELIGRNASLNGMAERLIPLLADVRTLTPASVGGEVDIVTANPPYMSAGSGECNRADELTMARHETAGGIADFCAAASRILKHGGHFYCVFRPERLTDLFTALRKTHLEPKRLTVVQATVASPPSMVLVDAVKYAAPALILTPPLILHESDPDRPDKPRLPLCDTPDTAFIYDHCAFPQRFTSANRPT